MIGHPANAIAWLVNRRRHSERLEPGEIDITGSFTRPVLVAAGDVIAAQFNALGALSVAFT